MTETSEASDLSTGLGTLFGLISILAAVGMAVTAYLAFAGGSDQMQLLSGVALTIAFVAGGAAIAAIHIYH